MDLRKAKSQHTVKFITLVYHEFRGISFGTNIVHIVVVVELGAVVDP